MLMAAAITALVLGALMGPLVQAGRDQARETSYTYAQQRARTALNEIIRQVRQAWQVLAAGPNSVEFNLYQGGVDDVVYYECDVPQPNTSYRECVRLTAPAGSQLPSLSNGTVVVTNLLNGTATSPVFSFSPSPIAPYYMTATVQVPAAGGSHYGLAHPMTFSDGTLMRNLNVGN